MNEKTIDEYISLTDELLKEKNWPAINDLLLVNGSDHYGPGNYFLHSYYIDTNKQRIFYLLDTFGAHYWKGKTVVELGGCIGPASNILTKLGAECEVWEGRQEIVEAAQIARKNIKYITKNLEEPFFNGKKFDIVINWGVLYHISEKNYESFLINSANLTKEIMFLDTNVWPLNENELLIKEIQENKNIVENSLVGKGTMATVKTIQTILEKSGFITIEKVGKKLDEQKFISKYTYVYDNTKWDLNILWYRDANNKDLYKVARRAWFNCFKL